MTEVGPLAAAGPDLRLLPAALLAWMAAWWATAAGATACVVAACMTACIGAGLVVVLGIRRRRYGDLAPQPWGTALLLAPAAVTVVLSATGAAQITRSAGPLPDWIAQRAVVEVRGRLTSDPHPVAAMAGAAGPPRFVLRMTVERVSGRGRSAPARVPLLVLGGAGWGALSAGQQVSVTGRLKAAEPGDNVVALLTALGAPGDVAAGGWPWRLADRLRAGLRAACTGLSRDGGGLLPSLVVGDTSTLSEPLRADLQVAGLTHITAVSGANVAIAAGSVLWLSTALGAGRRLRLALAAVTVVAFVVVARPEPSVLRAAVMGGLGLAGLAAARRPRGPAVLSAAVILLLAVDPWLARSPGFALSTAATAALLLLAPLWAERWSRRMPAPLAAALAVPAAAQAACGPLVILLQPSVSMLAVPANLLAEPAVAPATVAGVVAALLGAVWPTGAHLAAWCGSLATGWVALVAHRTAAAPGATLPWPPGLPGALLLAVLTVGLVAVSLWPSRGAGPHPPGRHPGREQRAAGRAARAGRSGRASLPGGGQTRRVALAAGAVLAGLLAGWVLGPRVPLPGRGGRWPPAGWAAVQCDVGQGDAMVLRSGVDRAVLVDAGPLPAAVDGCLRRLGIHHLDLVVLTHHHADHVLGLPGALHGRSADELVVSPLAEPAENAREVRQWAAAAGVPVVAGAVGLGGQVGEAPWQVRWQVLTAGVPVSAGIADFEQDGDNGSEVNESSLATLWEVTGPGGLLRVVGLGDLEVAGQQALAARIGDGRVVLGGPVDLVKVAHHGSAKQDGPLYRLLAPRLAVIGVGTGNDYGHPAPSALSMLRAEGLAVVRTDLVGDIAVLPLDDGTLRIATARP